MTTRAPTPAASGSTCVHCVVKRATDHFARLHSHRVAVWSSSTQAPLIAMEARRLYLLVYDVLRDVVREAGDAPVRVRLVNDAHPDVEILASARTALGVRIRSLRLPRHADDCLARGFAESAAR
jgi:hypothetical protein